MSQPLTQSLSSSLQSPPAVTSYVNVDLTTGGASSTDAGELKLPPGDTSNGSCSNSFPNQAQLSNQLPYSNPLQFPPPPPLYSEVPPSMQMPPLPGFGPASATTMQPGPGGMFYYQPNAAAGNSSGFNVMMVQQGAMTMGGAPPSFIIPWPNLVIILGIIASLLCFWILGIPAIILAVKAKNYPRSTWQEWIRARLMARCGLALAICGISSAFSLLVVIFNLVLNVSSQH